MSEAGHTMMVITWTYLLDSRGQVLDEKSPEVMERLQLSALCEARNTQLRQTKKKITAQTLNASGYALLGTADEINAFKIVF